MTQETQSLFIAYPLLFLLYCMFGAIGCAVIDLLNQRQILRWATSAPNRVLIIFSLGLWPVLVVVALLSWAVEDKNSD